MQTENASKNWDMYGQNEEKRRSIDLQRDKDIQIVYHVEQYR